MCSDHRTSDTERMPTRPFDPAPGAGSVPSRLLFCLGFQPRHQPVAAPKLDAVDCQEDQARGRVFLKVFSPGKREQRQLALLSSHLKKLQDTLGSLNDFIAHQETAAETAEAQSLLLATAFCQRLAGC
jgi:hypothetical protein